MQKKLLKRKIYSNVFISFDKQTIDLEIKDLNIYNVLSAIAVLKELKINIFKLKKNLNICSLLKEEAKTFYF